MTTDNARMAPKRRRKFNQAARTENAKRRFNKSPNDAISPKSIKQSNRDARLGAPTPASG